jgi:hypothetical protein
MDATNLKLPNASYDRALWREKTLKEMLRVWLKVPLRGLI